MEHGLRYLIRTSDTDARPTPSRPLFVCACGEIAAGIDGAHWTVVESPDGKRASLAPSVDMPGHYHDYYRDVPFTTYRELYPELFASWKHARSGGSEPEESEDHCDGYQ